MSKRRLLLTREFAVAAPLDRVWTELAAVERWPSWARHIRSVRLEPPGALVPTTVGTLRLAGGVTSTFEMVELQPGRSWRWEGGFLWLWVSYDHVLTALDASRTRVRFDVAAEGFAVGVLGRLFAVIYGRNLDRAIPRLIALLERGA